ncbi:phosphoglucosamine mutase [Pseudoflavonifractor sp. AF19-9AC]|uniref:phosphoglucosamine mutase n=1 Tax=Pseudoflavonifractor sp. AF19-9AC TaxID=2292244 RepID=UPI000E4F8F86|nr:phosphoglucosamine mutase [Pseudoflavonifractor sp. AF19-9AC]RHR11387.1 phosphoglucosamine mutase [Pseudoflavonifractor sp. AF19-9AC]
MGKLFGTDGIRGVVNAGLDADLAYKVGLAAAQVLAKNKKPGEKPVVTIGKDTRISGDLLKGSLIAGLCTAGADVLDLGTLPTPGVAWVTVDEGADAGIVISASHNPFEHNGIKIFNGKGFKLSDELEEKIEDIVLFGHNDVPRKTHGEIGKVSYVAEKAVADYIDHLQSTITSDLAGLRILVDCANGASYTTAARLFDQFPKLRTDVINADPDGININDKCGSTHMDSLAAMVKAGGYDIGIAFDGDADRCLAVDENGVLIDGDQVMAACGLDLKGKGKLPGDAVVATVMSNLGLHVFAKENGLKVECTDVGDRNVLERMVEKGYVLGGEQSGHMIFLDYATTGDGQLTALQILALLKESGKKASEVFGACQRYPQVLINIPVADNDVKKAVMASPLLAQAIQQEEAALGDDGRVLVRPSGTEALMRVMVEAKTQEVAQQTAQRLADLIAGL